MAQSSALLCMELAFIFIFIPQTRQKQEEWNDPAGGKERGESGHISSVKRMLPGWRRSKGQRVIEKERGEWGVRRRGSLRQEDFMSLAPQPRANISRGRLMAATPTVATHTNHGRVGNRERKRGRGGKREREREREKGKVGEPLSLISTIF